MTSLNRLSRLGGVSLLVLAVAAGGVLVEQTLPRAEAQQELPALHGIGERRARGRLRLPGRKCT